VNSFHSNFPGTERHSRHHHDGPRHDLKRGYRSRLVSQELTRQGITPKGRQRWRLTSFWTLAVVLGCLGLFGVISSTVSAQAPRAISQASAAFLKAPDIVARRLRSHIGRPFKSTALDTMVRPSGPSRLESRSTRRQVRVRNKNWVGLPSVAGHVAMMLVSCAGVATIISGSGLAASKCATQSSEAERERLHQATVASVDRIAAEAHAKLPHSKASSIGAIYARYSTAFQDSATDQIRELFDFAVKNKIFVPREYVYFDLGVRGYKNHRKGLDQLRTVLSANKVQELLLFATNRLFRKVFLTLQFVDQLVVELGIRCVFVKSAIDTANKDQWQALLHLRSIMDEFQIRVNSEHIRAALKGMFLEGLVRGTLHLGYTGEIVPGKTTKQGRPRRRIVVDEKEAELVRSIYGLYVNDALSINDIARKLNSMPDVPRPRKSSRWRHHSVRAVLLRETYRGAWKFSVTERKFLSSKDYVRQVPRQAPLDEATFENLRIVSDAVWFAAQQRLSKNTCVRGRHSKAAGADKSCRILSGLFWCPAHDRPLRSCSAYGNYLGCPVCATIDASVRPLFSKAHQDVVVQLLFKRLAELIRQDEELVSKIILECQQCAATLQRPDTNEVERLERLVTDCTRKIDFHRRNPGETEEELQESSEAVRRFGAMRKEAQTELAVIKAAMTEPVRVPDRAAVDVLLSQFHDTLQRAAAGQLGAEEFSSARDILQLLTGGRVEMHQFGERREMKGWLQGRFTLRVLDIFVERLTGRGRLVTTKRSRLSSIFADHVKLTRMLTEPLSFG
jgi:site-specific DNA recombinase